MLTAIVGRYDVFGDRTFILVRSYPVPTHSICMTVVVPSDHSESTRRELSTVSPSRPWSGIRIAAPGWSADTSESPVKINVWDLQFSLFRMWYLANLLVWSIPDIENTAPSKVGSGLCNVRTEEMRVVATRELQHELSRCSWASCTE